MLYYLVSLLAACSLCLAASDLTEGLQASNVSGATGAPTFDDFASIPENPMLSKLTFLGNDTLNGLSMTLVSGQNFTHFGSGGTPTDLQLNQGEYIISVTLCWGEKDGATRILYAEAGTDLAQTVATGNKTENCQKIPAPKNYGIVGAYGQVEKDIRQLGFYFARARESDPVN
ncbi:endonuclease/exonuclease/phosphatase family protein, putative, partial [Rhizoctonia solani AG-3 Rhs1AP]